MTVVKSNYAPRANHLYETEPWATLALFRHLDVRGLHVWETAAGNHRIADMALCAGAASVLTSDIERYHRDHNICPLDFLATSPAYGVGIDAIVTNPPFGPGNRLAAKFCRHALTICDGWIAMLCTAKFDSGKTRVDLFRDNPRYAYKITLLDRILWFDGPDAEDGTEDHAWYVWRPVSMPPAHPVMFYEESTYPLNRKRRKKRGNNNATNSEKHFQ